MKNQAIELLDEVAGDELLRRPGVYVASSSSPAYATLAALVAAGAAAPLGEVYLPGGVKRLAVHVRPRAAANPEAFEGNITIGAEYFSAALREYSQWRVKWWREAIQNAVDAGAREIRCATRALPDRSVEVSIEDDGAGMDQETLVTKFLVLGGTTKRAGAGATGGFGEAKKLLLLPWISWEIESRDGRATGRNIQYRYERLPAGRRGTRLTVIMPADQVADEAACLTVIARSSLPGIAFTVNGKPFRASHEAGREVYSPELEAVGGKVAVFHNPKAPGPGLWVRKNGLFMFDKWAPRELEGVVCAEIRVASTEVLTANRDGFSDWSVGTALERFVGKLAADVLSALKRKKGLIRQKFRGTGKFRSVSDRELRGALVEATLAGGDRPKPGALVERVTEILSTAGAPEDDDVPGPGAPPAGPLFGAPGAGSAGHGLNLRTSAAAAAEMVGALRLAGVDHAEAVARQLAWEPDFYLVNEVEGFRVPSRFFPATMTPTVRKLARFWAEMCRFVLIQLGSAETYGVGFVFDRDKLGAFLEDEDGEKWLLLNPYRDGDVAGELRSLASAEDLGEIYATAIHECVHLARRLPEHNEAFAAALTRAIAKTAGKERQVRAIRKAIVARAAARR